jgi:uncharacterized protein (TIGR02118 family)
MIRLDILYPGMPGSRFDLGYYLGTHMPMSKRLLGDACKGITLARGVAGVEPDAPPAYAMSCHLLFDSIDAFLAVWAQVGERLGGDIPNYTDVKPVIQFSELLAFH